MKNSCVDNLIKKLQEICIQETAILQQLERARDIERVYDPTAQEIKHIH